MNRLVDGWMNGQIDRKNDKIDEWMDEDGWVDCLIGRWMNKVINKWVN